MSNQAVEYDFAVDNEIQRNIYPTEGIDWASVPDNNSGNYSLGQINFNSVTMNGTDSNIQNMLSKALVTIPYTIDVTPENCNFTSDGTSIVKDNKFAVGTK